MGTKRQRWVDCHLLLRRIFLILPLLASLALLGCATSVKDLPLTRGRCSHQSPARESAIHIQYLGTGGYLFRYGTNALLTSPFFSNFSLPRVAAGPLWPKKGVIERHLPSLEGVEMALVGHSHYDHLLDLPFALKYSGSRATIYGSKATLNLLTNTVSNPIQEVESSAGNFNGGSPGKWFANSNGSIRIMALESMHAPHLLDFTLFSGPVKNPRTRLPWTAWGWKCGAALAYVIDFMKPDGKSIAYRMVYTDSAVDGTRFGNLPVFRKAEDQRKPDLAIVNLASFAKVDGYPGQYLTNLEAKRVIIGHWEDFFRPQTRPVKVVRGTRPAGFFKQLSEVPQEAPPIMPVPGACFTVTLPQ